MTVRSLCGAAALMLTTASCLNAVDHAAAIDELSSSTELPVTTDVWPADANEGAVGAVDISVWSSLIVDADVDCWWQRGVRHVIVGTQYLEVTRQQLDIATRGGMSVDLYIYLYWDESITDQVNEALALAAAYPAVGRIWLDVEERADGGSSSVNRPGNGLALSADDLQLLISEGLDACGDFPCGIYTGRGWWQTWFGDRPAFTDVPLWYARYDGRATLSTWPNDHFGGWAAPALKQFNEAHVCGISVDVNVMRPEAVARPPLVVLDRSIPVDDGGPPDAPTALHPDHGASIHTDWVRPTAPIQRDATGWQIEVDRWNGTAWRRYLLLELRAPSRTITPTLDNTTYRWRLRAKNSHGHGPWSRWAFFLYGAPTSVPTEVQVNPEDSSTPPPPPPPDPSTPPPPPPVVDGAAQPVSPPDGAAQAGPAVTLQASSVANATRYTFEVTVEQDGVARPYTSYDAASPTKTFYPVTHDAVYAWRVRATVSGQDSPWSSRVRFTFP